MTEVTLISILIVMKVIIILWAIALLFNILCNNMSLIGHFILFYFQIMIWFVIEEVQLRWEERHLTHVDKEEAIECMELKLHKALVNTSLNTDIIELGYILHPEDIDMTQSVPQCYSHLIPSFKQSWNNSKHEDIGLRWLVARGYTANKLNKLKEDMPRILAYLRNAQTAKAIDAL